MYSAIRIGLKQVKGIAQRDLASIAAARAERPFDSLEDFCRRTTVPRNVIENLILCGAFDSINPRCRELLWRLEAAVAGRAPAPVEDAQLSLAGGLGHDEDAKSAKNGEGGERETEGRGTGNESRRSGERVGAWECGSVGVAGSDAQHPTPSFPEPTPFEKVHWEIDILGLTVGTHPAVLFRDRLAPYQVTPAIEVCGQPDGKIIRAAGVVVCRMRPPTKSGVVVVFITLEDETGLVDTVIFPKVYDQYGKVAFASDLLVVEGRVQKMGKRAVSLIAERIFNPLEGMVEDRLDGKTGVAHREAVLPAASSYAPEPATRDYNPAEEDPFHPQFPDPLAAE